MQNRDGIVAWVSDAGTVGAAVYDPAQQQWQESQLSSNPGNTLVIGQGLWLGVRCWHIGRRGVQPYTHQWDEEQFNSNSSNSQPTITDGTVEWTNNNGTQRYGYTGSQDWQNDAFTTAQCVYFPVMVGAGGELNVAYLSCLSIGASTYSHQCADGHTITRRWAWKAYVNPGSYSPELTVFSSVSNSTCNGSLFFVGVGLEELNAVDVLVVTSQNGELVITSNRPLGQVTVYDSWGRTIAASRTTKLQLNIPLQAAPGCYFVSATDAFGGLRNKAVLVGGD
ncbi:MAG: hypothetical protein IPP33_03800 [Flavobacteriales bacterium]|nr:hypothetical protein [Flavobacteriales bacterium]